MQANQIETEQTSNKIQWKEKEHDVVSMIERKNAKNKHLDIEKRVSNLEEKYILIAEQGNHVLELIERLKNLPLYSLKGIQNK